MNPYIANTSQDVASMLQAIGQKSIDDLLVDIKPRHYPQSFDLPKGKSEFEVFEYLKGLSRKNGHQLTLFIGGGFYDHSR